MKIAFFGSTIFSLEILKKLLELDKLGKIELAYVVSQPAKPFGRKKELKDNVVAEFCHSNSITLFTPNKIKELKDNSEFIIHNSELALAIVAAYGKILPKWLLDSSKNGFINFHGSLLPKYRGAVPVQMTVMNQDWDNGGVTIQKMEESMDTGAMLAQLPIFNFQLPINNITTGEMMVELAKLAADYVENNSDYLLNPESWKLVKQDDSLATYCYVSDMTKEKMEIKFEDGANLAHGKVMASNPAPLAWLELKVKSGELRVNLVRARLNSDILNLEKTNQLNLTFNKETKKLFLELNDGFVEILELQPQGKNVMDAKSFANGYLKYL